MRARNDGDNPRWLCLLLTAVPVLAGLLVGPWLVPTARQPAPAAALTLAARTHDHE